MSVPPSRAQSEVFSASQYGGAPPISTKRYIINHFAIPSFVIHVIGLACLWTLWYYLRYNTNLLKFRSSINKSGNLCY